jgi:lysophospholipase L1-like esterase
MTRWLALALALVLTITAAACGGSSSPKTYEGLYVSLGDSVAAGNGASDRASTSYAALLARDEGGLEIANVAVAGSTTRDVIDKQLAQVDDAAHGKKLAFITISVGGNDLASLIPHATSASRTTLLRSVLPARRSAPESSRTWMRDHEAAGSSVASAHDRAAVVSQLLLRHRPSVRAQAERDGVLPGSMR